MVIEEDRFRWIHYNQKLCFELYKVLMDAISWGDTNVEEERKKIISHFFPRRKPKVTFCFYQFLYLLFVIVFAQLSFS